MPDDRRIGYPSLLFSELPGYGRVPRFTLGMVRAVAMPYSGSTPSTDRGNADGLQPAEPPFGLRLSGMTRLINRDGERGVSDGPTFYNWCGGNWSGGRYSPTGRPMGDAPPMNSLDAKCLQHDYCYDRAGDNRQAVDDCDRQLLDDVRGLAPHPRNWPNPPAPGTEFEADAVRKAIDGLFTGKSNAYETGRWLGDKVDESEQWLRNRLKGLHR